METQKIVFENRTDEPFRTFKSNCVGTMRTTDACGDKMVIEIRKVDMMYDENTIVKSRAEQSRAEQSRAEQSSLVA